MDTGTAKAIEAIVIVALVVGFYVQQQRALKGSKEDSDANHSTDDDAGRPDAEDQR